MATIEIAQKAGACYGVERALKLGQEAAQKAAGRVHTLGPLIHNPQVVASLEAQGITVVTSPDQARGATLVMRTHGVAPQVEAAAHEAGATVIDATCPFVKKAHVAAERLSQEGYSVVIVGEQGHPEVEGTLGHAPLAVVVANAQELACHKLGKRVGVVVQTTQTRACLAEVVSSLLDGRADEVRVMDTICEATRERQDAAAELAARAQVMVVIGGKNSANTTHLAAICKEVCPKTYHIETPQELDPAWFAEAELIGITAGASTPAVQIEGVYQALKDLLDK